MQNELALGTVYSAIHQSVERMSVCIIEQSKRNVNETMAHIDAGRRVTANNYMYGDEH